MATSKIQNRNRTRKESENGCPVCHERMDIFAIGRCDHVVCYKCATRMRVLCDQKYCAICRADLQQLLFVRHRHKFDSVSTTNFCINRQFMIFFEDSNILERFDRLLENRCKLCPEKESFTDFAVLDKHMKREHVMFYCKLCVEHLRLFSVDRKFYNRQQLAQHNRHGDRDDTSYKGHPLCQFCSEHYFDNDELLRHLRKQHFFCHFCEADGVTSEYFNDYNALRDHFKAEHILCEEGLCVETQFVNVFRSDIDYRAHWSQTHSTGAARQHIRQMRTLDINVNFAPRDHTAESGYQRRGGAHRYRGGGARNDRESDRQNKVSSDIKQTVSQRRETERKRREEIDQAHALSLSLAAHGHISLIHPALNSLITTTSVTTTTTTTDGTLSDRQFQRRSDDFPTLSAVQQQQTDGSLGDAVTGATTGATGITAGATTGATGSTDQSLSLARKLALSSRFTVSNGSQDYKEFPCLPVSSQPQRPISAPQVKQIRRQAIGGHKMTETDFPVLQSNRPTTSTTTTSRGVNSTTTTSRGVTSTTTTSTAGSASTTTSKLSKTGNNKKSSGASVAWSDNDKKPGAMSCVAEVEEEFPSLPVQQHLEALSHQQTISSLSDISRNFSSNSLLAMNNETAAAQDETGHRGQTQKGQAVAQGETEWGQSVTQGQAQRGHSVQARKPDTYPSIVNDDTWGPALYKDTSTTEPAWTTTKTDKKTSGQKWQTGKPEKQVEESKNHGKIKGKTSGKERNEKSLKMEKTREIEQKTKPQCDQLAKDNGQQWPTASTGNNKVEMDEGKDEQWKTVTEKCNTTPGGKKKQAKQNGTTGGATDGTISGMCGDGNVARFSVLVDETSDTSLTDKNINKNNTSTKRNLKRKDTTTNTDLTDDRKKSPQNNSTGTGSNNTGSNSTGSNADCNRESVTDNKENTVTDTEQCGITVDTGFTLSTDDFPCLLATAINTPVNTPVATCITPVVVCAPPGFHHVSLTAVPPIVAVAKPPPGFSVVCIRPPPGLTTPATTLVTLPLSVVDVTTPGNTLVVDSVIPVELSGVTPVLEQTATYIPPRDAVQRNQRLLDNVTSVVRDIVVFRELSADFRCSKLSAAEYHLQCRNIMQSTDCRDIFPELIALLPDITKQQELLKVHREFVASTDWSTTTSECRSAVGRSTWSTVSTESLSVVMCVVCGQVVQLTDQQQHQLEHNFDSNFPSLETLQNNSAPFASSII